MNKYLIKKYYKMGIYTAKQLDVFVKSGFITEQEKQKMMED